MKKLNMNQLFLTGLMVCIWMMLITAFIASANEATSGTCGENVTWTFADGTLTISGTGDMKDYEGFGDFPDYRELEVTDIIVEEGITSIGSCAFHGLSNARNVSLPNTITKINHNAFVFSGVEHLVIPDSVKHVGYYVVTDAVVTLHIGSGVEKFDDAIMFNHGTSLKNITVSEENKHFCAENNVLFNKDKTKLICYPGGKEDEAYNVPNSVKVIGKNAFAYCRNLKNINIPEGVTDIQAQAFFATWGMENIQLPNSLNTVDSSCFEIGSSGMDLKYTYIGTQEQFNKIAITQYKGDSGDEIYDAVPGKLPEYCVDIEYNPVIKVLIDGEPIVFDMQQPIAENGRTLVPLRAIFEALGASVEWHGDTQTVTAVKDDVSIILMLGKNIITVNGVDKELDVPAKAINGRTLVPVRAVSESFGCSVTWDGATQTVIIKN